MHVFGFFQYAYYISTAKSIIMEFRQNSDNYDRMMETM